MRRILLLILLGLILVAAVIWLLFRQDMRAVNNRMSSTSDLVSTAFGPVAYAAPSNPARRCTALCGLKWQAASS